MRRLATSIARRAQALRAKTAKVGALSSLVKPVSRLPKELVLPNDPDRPVRFLVPSGIGDIHWIMHKIQGISDRLRRPGQDGPVEVWAWSSGTKDRAEDYVRRVPHVRWGGYWLGGNYGNPFVGEYRKLCTTIDSFKVDYCGFDLFISMNALLERGIPLEQIGSDVSTDWSFRLRVPEPLPPYVPRDSIIVFVVSGSFYSQLFDRSELHQALNQLSAMFPETQLIFVGREWDRPSADEMIRRLSSQARERARNLAGTTTFGQFLTMCRETRGLIGFAAGNGMVALHHGARVCLLWPRSFKDEFMRSWADPSKGDRYLPLKEISKESLTPLVRLLSS